MKLSFKCAMKDLRDFYLERMDWEDAVYPDFRTPEEIEEIVEIIRLELYNRELPCGPKAIRKSLEHEMIRPLPSERTIARILARKGLTHGRIGWCIGDEAEMIEKGAKISGNYNVSMTGNYNCR